MKSVILLADGFETCEALITVDVLRRAGIKIDTVSIMGKEQVISSHRIHMEADYAFQEVDMDTYDLIILPGGKLGTKNLEEYEPLAKAIENHLAKDKPLAAICAAPSILGKRGYLKGKKYTCFPSFDGEYGGFYQEELSVVDGNLITARGMGATLEFARNIVKFVLGEEALDELDYGIQYEHRFKELKKGE
ncbi:MAG: DJ-1/PfpI family protein [Solobacterium sp.]|nr:DJ-1/PfpI family protein [Solobacterium sp.]